MSENQIAGLSMSVDVSQVNDAAKSLANFKQANNETKRSVEDLAAAEAMARAKAKALKEEQEKLAAETLELKRGLDGIVKSIDPTAGKMQKLAEAAKQLDRAWEKGIVPDKEFFRLGEVIDNQSAKLRNAQLALTEEGRAAIENSKAKQRATSASKSFLDSLKEQAETTGMSKIELLEYKAAQMGVSQQAAPLIAKLNQQSKAMGVAGLSAGRYRMAMQQLPMQITDVVTSLASGMPIWLVAIQQGGQIKDSFGGVSNTFKLLLQQITPLRVAMVGFVSALAGVGIAAYDAYNANRQFETSLIMTGNYAAASTGQLASLTEELNKNSISTIGALDKVAATLAGSGKYTLNQIKQITAVTADWSEVTGESTDKIIGYFDDIAKDPVKGLAKLNEQFNFLDKGQLTYISTLEKTKGKTAAVTEATKIFADVMEDRVGKIADSATPLEKMWTDIKKWSADAWRWVGDHTIGALNLIVDVVAGTVEQVQYLLNSGDSLIRGFVLSAQEAFQKIPGFKSIGEDAIAQNKKILADNEETNKKLLKSIAERDARIRKGEMGYIEAAKKRGEMDKQYAAETKDAVRKEAEELAKKNAVRKKGVADGVKVSEQYQAELLALEAQLKVLQDHKALDDKISQQRKTYWNDVAKFQILEQAAKTRTLTADEKSLLANKSIILAYSEQKALLGDKIVSQERMNALLDKSAKTILELDQKMAAMDATKGMGDMAKRRADEIAKMKADWEKGGGSLDDKAYQDMEEKQQAYYEREDALRSDWLAGAENGFATWAENAGNMYAQTGAIAQATMSGMTDEITNFVTTGKADFADFTASILKMISKMLVQMALLNAMKAAFGGTEFGSMMGLSSHANGGVVGNGFARGGYTGNGGKYEPAGIVHRGEFVFTKEATKRIGVANLHRMMRGYASGGVVGGSSSGGGSGSGGVVIGVGDININGMGGVDQSAAKGMEQGVRQVVMDVLTRECSQGGRIYQLVKG